MVVFVREMMVRVHSGKMELQASYMWQFGGRSQDLALEATFLLSANC